MGGRGGFGGGDSAYASLRAASRPPTAEEGTSRAFEAAMAQARVLIQTSEDLVVPASDTAAPSDAEIVAAVRASNEAPAPKAGLKFRVCSPTKEQRLEMLRQSVAEDDGY